jgi:hypothetical protein
VCRTASDGNFLRRIKRERGTHPYDMVKEKWYGGSDDNVTGTGTTAAGRKSFRQDAKPDLSGCIFDGGSCQKCFCVTFDESNKACAVSALKDTDKKRCEVVFIGEND